MVTAVDVGGNESDPSAEENATPFGIQRGDADGNGSINIIDALQIARYDAGLAPDPFILVAADADCGGDVDIIDALQIARYDAGLISGFCA